MNKVSVLGLLLCFGAMILGIVTSGGIETVGRFLNLPSAIVTFGGALFCVMASADSLQDFISGLKSFSIILKATSINKMDMIQRIIGLSNIARKEGLLALEEKNDTIEDPFLKKGLGLVVDGIEPDLVRDIMEIEMDNVDEQNRKNINFWDDLGAMGPAWGMIGTLLGLINMMQSMGNDSSSIGPSMALALITTLYGSVLANWICAPVSRKLKKNNIRERQMKEITIEGLLSIQAGENPRVIMEKLKSFLEEKDKVETETNQDHVAQVIEA